MESKNNSNTPVKSNYKNNSRRSTDISFIYRSLNSSSWSSHHSSVADDVIQLSLSLLHWRQRPHGNKLWMLQWRRRIGYSNKHSLLSLCVPLIRRNCYNWSIYSRSFLTLVSLKQTLFSASDREAKNNHWKNWYTKMMHKLITKLTHLILRNKI